MTSARLQHPHLRALPPGERAGMGATSLVRALIYARFSSALQSEASIDDQVRICRERASAEGWDIAGVFTDYAISGAVRERPGLNGLLAALAKRGGDVVVTESIDRLSRDQEDIANIFKRVVFANARIVTLSEGEIGEIHIGLKGTMSAMFRRDLADKVRRGLTGRALAGSNPGGLAYGYRKVPRFDADGEPVRGLREIDPEEAAIVVRIFDEFVAGRSARDIARRLNAESVPSPSGAEWSTSSVAGDRARRNGILSNDLYVGRVVYNKTRRVYDPDTRTRRIRLNPASDWVHVDAQELRIVPDAAWNAVEEMRARHEGVRPEVQRRPKRLLSGLAFCGVCGARWIVRGVDRWGCSRYANKANCANGRTISTRLLESRVLSGLEERLLDPELVAVYVREWHEARARRSADAERARSRIERALAAATRKTDRLIKAVTEGGSEFAAIREALSASRIDQDRLNAQLADIGASSVIALHPGVTDDYRRQVASLREELARGDEEGRHAAFGKLRALIDRVTVLPAPDKGTVIHFEGRLKALLELATGPAPSALYVNAGAA